MPRLSKIGAAALAAFGWTGISSVSASYLVVAGGGGGGAFGGGGGAGGFRTGSSISLNPSLSYTVTVGAGGAGSAISGNNGISGSDSVFSTITSTGGGGGGSNVTNGSSGGSGGGGSRTGTGGAATPVTSPVQGYAGGAGATNSSTYFNSGGGGGSSAVGGNAIAVAGNTQGGGTGGAGTASSISGSSVTYAGGGGGGGYGANGGPGGSGGAGSGGGDFNTVTSATANTGSGGGGGAALTVTGGNGGSGIVIISYPAPQQFGGGVVTTSGGNIIHTFTTSGTLSPITPISASYTVVAGGGGGGVYAGGGGGAGGMRSGTSLSIDSNSTYLITVGAGGAGATTLSAQGVNGSSSSLLAVTSAGGGGGGVDSAGSYINGVAGGSGGGGGSVYGGSSTGGASSPVTSPVQGYAGGSTTTVSGSSYSGSGGGGGAGGAGGTPSVVATGGGYGPNGYGTSGNGGVGLANPITGSTAGQLVSTTYYLAGGGGAGGASTGAGTYLITAGTGGSGGGASGTGANSVPANATANTGGGGGGGGMYAGIYSGGSNGGSGVVIISYPGSTQLMAGGTVSIVGGNVIHTFTNSGYLAPIKYSTGSLRFRASASAYLARTPTVVGSRKTWTWSAWVKRANIGTTSELLGSYGLDNNTNFAIEFSGDTLYLGLYSAIILQTTAVYRDPAAWYHIVVAFDSTQSTASNRVLLYVNGVLVTAFSTDGRSSITQNGDYGINNTSVHNIGRNPVVSARYFDGEMTEINLIDGQALTPNSFGTFNSYGVWQPITYGGSYGTNGFYLPFNRQSTDYVGLFNGSSQYLTLANNAAFTWGTGSFTVEFWLCTATKTNYQCVVGQYGGGSTGWYVETDSTGLIHYGTNGSTQLYSTKNVCDGVWHHIAVVRNGSSALTMYIDGVANATASDTNDGSAPGQPLCISLLGGGYTRYVNGNISNLRIVKGTAVYTSNFTVPTSALTNISGTSLLTLQNATIVDNSSNAFTITNNGSVTTQQSFPFSTGAFSDQSPVGNNWTPTNISGLFGSTFDLLGDAPTLTSSTVANYCTLNPLDGTGTAASTVYGGNLNWQTNTSVGGSAYNANGYTFGGFPATGKWYHEWTANSLSIANTGYIYFQVGNAYIWWVYGGTYQIVGSNGTTSIGALSAGDVVQVAVDSDSGKLWFGKNNTWYTTSGTPDPAAGTGASSAFTASASPVYANIQGRTGNSVQDLSFNFGQQPFKYTPPTGFVAINAYNL